MPSSAPILIATLVVGIPGFSDSARTIQRIQDRAAKPDKKAACREYPMCQEHMIILSISTAADALRTKSVGDEHLTGAAPAAEDIALPTLRNRAKFFEVPDV